MRQQCTLLTCGVLVKQKQGAGVKKMSTVPGGLRTFVVLCPSCLLPSSCRAGLSPTGWFLDPPRLRGRALPEQPSGRDSGGCGLRRAPTRPARWRWA